MIKIEMEPTTEWLEMSIREELKQNIFQRRKKKYDKAVKK